MKYFSCIIEITFKIWRKIELELNVLTKIIFSGNLRTECGKKFSFLNTQKAEDTDEIQKVNLD